MKIWRRFLCQSYLCKTAIYYMTSKNCPEKEESFVDMKASHCLLLVYLTQLISREEHMKTSLQGPKESTQLLVHQIRWSKIGAHASFAHHLVTCVHLKSSMHLHWNVREKRRASLTCYHLTLKTLENWLNQAHLAVKYAVRGQKTSNM